MTGSNPKVAEARPEQTAGAVPAGARAAKALPHQRSDLLPDIAVATDRPGRGDGVRLKAVVAAAGAVPMALEILGSGVLAIIRALTWAKPPH